LFLLKTDSSYLGVNLHFCYSLNERQVNNHADEEILHEMGNAPETIYVQKFKGKPCIILGM
jgi:hypothetical protein